MSYMKNFLLEVLELREMGLDDDEIIGTMKNVPASFVIEAIEYWERNPI